MIGGKTQRVVDIENKRFGIFKFLIFDDFETRVKGFGFNKRRDGKNLSIDVKKMSVRNRKNSQTFLERQKLFFDFLSFAVIFENIIKKIFFGNKKVFGLNFLIG